MQVICQQCNATYRIPESRIPARRASFPCKRCGKRVIVEPPAAVSGDQESQAKPRSPVPEAAQAPTTQSSAITAEFPETTVFDPQKYPLDHLLVPNKKGRFKTRINKFKLKLLGAVQGTLDQLLDQNEQVMHIAAATGYYPAELILGNGWMTLLYNRYILVGTNKRLVAINTDYKLKKPSHYLFQFPYNEIKKTRRGLFGTSLVLTRKMNKRRTFTSIMRPLAAELKTFIDSKIDPSAALEADAQVRESLCPSCFTPLAGQLSNCPECHVIFKSPRKAALRSLLLPGWGDIYLGHRFLGFLESLGSLVVWGICLTLLLSNHPSDVIVAVVILLFYNGMDSLLSLHMAKKGYSLEKSHSRTAPADHLSTSQA
jgi:zinc-ribbon domain